MMELSSDTIKKVSVVVPNYNYARYLKKRTRSIVRQTYPIYELIILDDASTDESIKEIEKIVADLKVKYPELSVRFVSNTKNSGKSIAQWLKGFELAEGDYVWIAEADDLCSRKFLAEVMKGFDDPGVVMSYAESRIINGRGIMIAPNFRWSRDKERTGHYKKSYIKNGAAEIKEIMAIRCTVPNVSAVVFKKTPECEKYLKEALKFRQVGDWYFYVELLKNGKIAYNYKALNHFRVHGGSVTANSKKAEQHYEEILKMHEYFKKNYKLDEQILASIDAEESRVRERIENLTGIGKQNC